MTAVPTLVSEETVIGPGQLISGGSATAATGGGVGAVGVLLHPAPQQSASSTRKALIRPH
jgi:hypothetical protein